VSSSAARGTAQESDIDSGLALVARGQYVEAVPRLVSGRKWLTSDPAYKASTDPLVMKEAEFISRLIQQIQDAHQKQVFADGNPMGQAVGNAIQTQASVIKTVDERRRMLTGAAPTP
jgi:hypothetical protein